MIIRTFEMVTSNLIVNWIEKKSPNGNSFVTRWDDKLDICWLDF